MKAKYICGNCGAAQERKHVEAMLAAGFQVRHLPCRECGSHDVQGPAERFHAAELAGELVTSADRDSAMQA